ncbi:hypothetical protein [Streptomyces sp. NPDC088350]|uniref:hypothetical protein n=1 Tax=Streptomyces sp. NPDC088350 TaxID=3365854 RepID=UPI00382B6939
MNDRVDVGVIVNSCGGCGPCHDGTEQFRAEGVVARYNSLDHDSSSNWPAPHRWVRAGITVYSPIRRWGPVKDKSVAVNGVSGLGHLAVRMAAATGGEVTAVSRSIGRHATARRPGALTSWRPRVRPVPAVPAAAST